MTLCAHFQSPLAICDIGDIPAIRLNNSVTTQHLTAQCIPQFAQWAESVINAVAKTC
jgi:hypothetical protein